MGDRRDLQAELNRINELYQTKDLEMRKAGASIEQRQMMRDMLNQKKEQLVAEMGDDLADLNAGKSINISKGSKFKKLAGVIPFAGAALAAAQGDPAMAAEELAGDIPVAGQVYEAIKPEDAGNRQEEAQMLAERKAKEDYKKSPASRDSRFSKLSEYMGLDKEEPESRKEPGQRAPVTPEKYEALTGTEHPELKEKNRMQQLIDSKIEQLEQSDDPNSLESLNYWKEKRKSY